jgi:diacylglycerol kinase (ATP)
LIVNPNARQGDADLSEVVDRLKRIGPVVSSPGADAAGTQRAISQHAKTVRRVVIGGGDGTLSAALPALLAVRLPLGVLPLGTANDFARSIGISDLATAVDAIVSGHTRAVDVGLVNGVHFLNAVGIGLGPRINRDLDTGTKSRFGVLGYFLHFLRHAREERSLHAEIDCDGEIVAVRSLQITIANGIHYGGGMTIAKDASLEDGMLDVLSIRPRGALRLLLRGPAIRSGEADDRDLLQTFRGKVVRVWTQQPMEVTADGEPVTRTPVQCRALRGALTVFAPPGEGAE